MPGATASLRIGLGLSVPLLLIWPDPAPTRPAIVGLTLAVIHALPLLTRLWLSRAMELCVVAAAFPLVALRHFGKPFGDPDALAALASVGGAALTLTAGALGSLLWLWAFSLPRHVSRCRIGRRACSLR